MRELLALERAALRRLGERRALVLLALLAAEVGAFALATALAHVRAVLWSGAPEAILESLAAVPLGLDLALVLGTLGLGAAVTAIARPGPARGLVVPATRTAAGAVTIGLVAFIVVYALGLGLLRLVPELLSRQGPLWARAGLLALALAPALFVAWILGTGALAALALVGRGLRPGMALAAGLDHAQRRPTARWLSLLHGACGLVVVALAIALAPTGPGRLLVAAPLASLSLLWAVAAFDAALGRDPRLATG